jgi:serine/threonine protein kinase
MKRQATQFEHGCLEQEIDLFLDGNDLPLHREYFDRHLESCDSCRRYLEKQAADQHLWQEAQAMLTDRFLPAPAAQEDKSEQLSAMIKAVLGSLPRSEFPEHLGRLGNHEITGVVGSGGMGVVLKAIDTTLDRTVAIKVLAPHLANNETARKRFSREARAAAAVIHPNVIPIHSVSEDKGLPYLTMTFVKGGSLQQRLVKEGPFTPAAILRIGAQIAAGLGAAHDQGLVHRDIKPANILLEQGVERVAITDFGLARAVDDASITQSQIIAGTPQFMSPEQARGEAIDQRSDLFGLGSLLYTLATGRPPFRADSSYGVMRKICDDSPMPIRALNPDIPDWLSGFINKLMHKTPAGRFESANDVARKLEESLAHLQQPSANELPAEVAALGRNSKSKVRIAIGLGLVTVVLVTLAFALIFSPTLQKEPVRSSAESNQIAALIANWKEHDPHTEEAGQKREKIKELHAVHAGMPGTEKFLEAKRMWANELLPILLAGVEVEKAHFLHRFTEPFAAIRLADEAAAQGQTTQPIGWDWQAIHMLALGRAELLADSYEENDLLINKIEVNIRNGVSPDSKTYFLGEQCSLQEILRECRLHRAMIQAIHGPPSPGPVDNDSNE